MVKTARGRARAKDAGSEVRVGSSTRSALRARALAEAEAEGIASDAKARMPDERRRSRDGDVAWCASLPTMRSHAREKADLRGQVFRSECSTDSISRVRTYRRHLRRLLAHRLQLQARGPAKRAFPACDLRWSVFDGARLGKNRFDGSLSAASPA